MEANEPLLNLLAQQRADGLLDSAGRFRIDRNILKEHYSSRLEDDSEAILFFIQSAHRWGATGMEFRLLRSELMVEIALEADSLVRNRLSTDPQFRLSALFPRSHFLFELAQGYNILTYSELSRGIHIVVNETGLRVSWKFWESASVRASIQKFFGASSLSPIPCALDLCRPLQFELLPRFRQVKRSSAC